MAILKIKGKWNKVKEKIKQSYAELFDDDPVNFRVKDAEEPKQKP